MRRIAKKTVLYQCEKCKTEYSNARDAKRCESYTVEEKVFEIGQRVQTKEPRQRSSDKDSRYICKGTVTAIKGPVPFNADQLRWFKNEILNPSPRPFSGHLWQYEISFTHPIDGEKNALYYAVELISLNRRK